MYRLNVRFFWKWGLVVFILILGTFMRFWEMGERMQFTHDQVQNAWVMKSMVLDGHRPIEGMVAKGTTGFSIGPLYYYLLVIPYALFHLDPIAAGMFAATVGLITLLVLLLITRSLFTWSTALIAGYIYAVCWRVVMFDRIAWPVVFIPLLAIGIYYLSVRWLEGNVKSSVGLGTLLGLSFHFHFTAVLFAMIIAFVGVWTRWSWQKIRWMGAAFLCLAIFLAPLVLANWQSGGTQGNHMITYAQSYYHGLHARRILQLLPEMFIDLNGVIGIPGISQFGWIVLLVSVALLVQERKFAYVLTMLAFFVVPLIAFSTYKGELTDYYYSLQRPLAVLLLAYILGRVWSTKKPWGYIIVLLVLVGYGSWHVQQLLHPGYISLPKLRQEAQAKAEQGIQVPFSEYDPNAYLGQYYYYKIHGTWP